MVRGSEISRAELVLGQPTCSLGREEVVAQGKASHPLHVAQQNQDLDPGL